MSQDLHAEFEANQVIDRYLMGKLSAAETARFEEHYLGCPECLEQLKLAERFQGAIKRAAAEDVARLTVSTGLLAWLARRQAWLPAAAVLTLALALLPIWWTQRQFEEQQQRFETQLASATSPQGNTPILRLGQTRGTLDPGQPQEPSHRLELHPDTRWAVLSLALEPPIAERYLITLERENLERETLERETLERETLEREAGAGELWRATDQLPTLSDTLDLSLPASLLSPGIYRLQAKPQVDGDAATADPAADPASTFRLRVVPLQVD
ncbi:MAG: zf-HC2 domain-containing protein [Acidobacteriota bacterium]